MKTFKKMSIGLLVLVAFSGLWAYDGTWSLSTGSDNCLKQVTYSGF